MEKKIYMIIARFTMNPKKIKATVSEILDLFAVSGMFSSDKLEQAYKDGVRDALSKGYGTFDEVNYR
jgi:hypothetical protein